MHSIKTKKVIIKLQHMALCYVSLLLNLKTQICLSILLFYFNIMGFLMWKVHMACSHMCDGMISVCSVKVIDQSIRGKISSLQGHNFPRFIQAPPITPTPSPPPVPLRPSYCSSSNKTTFSMLLHPYCLAELPDWSKWWETSARPEPTYSYGDVRL